MNTHPLDCSGAGRSDRLGPRIGANLGTQRDVDRPSWSGCKRQPANRSAEPRVRLEAERISEARRASYT
jgi:hypothetical protein